MVASQDGNVYKSFAKLIYSLCPTEINVQTFENYMNNNR